MKRLVLTATAAGGAAFAFSRLARKGRAMHEHCREMMRDRCSQVSAGCRPSRR